MRRRGGYAKSIENGKVTLRLTHGLNYDKNRKYRAMRTAAKKRKSAAAKAAKANK